MEWHRLRVFYYVAKAQSISRAAMELNTAQPAVTRSIQQLEYQAKSKLFIRHSRGLTLTKQGEILFDYVKNFVAELEQAKNEMSGLSQETSGSLESPPDMVLHLPCCLTIYVVSLKFILILLYT